VSDNLSDYLENALLNAVLRATSYTSPTTVYLALFTTPTSDAAPGTEVSGGSYARQAVTFAAPSGGLASNSGVITFSNMPACTITHSAIMDALTGGNMLFQGSLPSARTLAVADSVTFAVGSITATLA
jgi:hypothetical protein